VADQGDPEILQVLGSQARQDLGIDRVVAKRRSILFEAEPAQSIGDIERHPKCPLYCRFGEWKSNYRTSVNEFHPATATTRTSSTARTSRRSPSRTSRRRCFRRDCAPRRPPLLGRRASWASVIRPTSVPQVGIKNSPLHSFRRASRFVCGSACSRRVLRGKRTMRRIDVLIRTAAQALLFHSLRASVGFTPPGSLACRGTQ
jgi:hypothetical protein